jgi:hypothetical protein
MVLFSAMLAKSSNACYTRRCVAFSRPLAWLAGNTGAREVHYGWAVAVKAEAERAGKEEAEYFKQERVSSGFSHYCDHC